MGYNSFVSRGTGVSGTCVGEFFCKQLTYTKGGEPEGLDYGPLPRYPKDFLQDSDGRNIEEDFNSDPRGGTVTRPSFSGSLSGRVPVSPRSLMGRPTKRDPSVSLGGDVVSDHNTGPPKDWS